MDENTALEHMINYLATRNYTSRHFDPSEISFGNGEVGIDGMAIVVNDTIIESLLQLESCFADNREVTASIVFIQTKSSEKLDISEINHFFASVKDFLSGGKINNNAYAVEMQKVCNFIFEHPTQLSKNPDCHLFYAYTGDYDSNNTIATGFIEQFKKDLKQTAFYDDITVSIHDAGSIVRQCREIKNTIKRTIELSDIATIPPIENVTESYIGVAKCKDFIRLITNEQGAIISNLFEDNVRYFQGNNAVNAEVQTTLRNEKKQREFSILNNGVTIVAKEVRITGKSITLCDFQVVNGCQTSFVLYENRNRLKDDTCVVIKVISTTDKDISDKIVKTTNRQTPVQSEAFETLRDFHKDLETVYLSYPLEMRLFYERRSKQYDSEDIQKNRIISLPFQTKAYIAVFLGEPQSIHRYYGELLRSYSKQMYNDGDILEQYCIASMFVYIVEKYLRQTVQHLEYKQYKFHIALLLRCMIAGKQMPKQNSKEMKKLCETYYEKIADDKWVKANTEKAIGIINTVLKNPSITNKDGNQAVRQKEFTNSLLEELGTTSVAASVARKIAPIKKGLIVSCKVTGWNNSFVYVDFIDYREIGSIHIREITGEYISDISDVLQFNQEIKAVIIEDEPHSVYGYHLSISQVKHALN
jgi:hypothetical protein